MKIYAIPCVGKFKDRSDRCFQECGKIQVGGLIVEGIPCLPCMQEKCEYEENTMKYDGKLETGGTTYDEVYLRKLLPVKEQKNER